jgi:thioredoxin
MSVTAVGTDNFTAQVLQSEIPVFVDFFATWCGPCRAVAPTIDRLAEEFAGKFKFVKVDIDQSRELAEQFNIEGVPTFVIFVGGQEAGRVVGARPRDSFIQILRQFTS